MPEEDLIFTILNYSAGRKPVTLEEYIILLKEQIDGWLDDSPLTYSDISDKPDSIVYKIWDTEESTAVYLTFHEFQSGPIPSFSKFILFPDQSTQTFGESRGELGTPGFKIGDQLQKTFEHFYPPKKSS